jgi:hypothetical protein
MVTGSLAPLIQRDGMEMLKGLTSWTALDRTHLAR